jgi:hypothetical protein
MRATAAKGICWASRSTNASNSSVKPDSLPSKSGLGADLDIMRSDTVRMRTGANGQLKPFVMTNLKTNAGLAEVIAFIETKGMLQAG